MLSIEQVLPNERRLELLGNLISQSNIGSDIARYRFDLPDTVHQEIESSSLVEIIGRPDESLVSRRAVFLFRGIDARGSLELSNQKRIASGQPPIITGRERNRELSAVRLRRNQIRERHFRGAKRNAGHKSPKLPEGDIDHVGVVIVESSQVQLSRLVGCNR